MGNDSSDNFGEKFEKNDWELELVDLSNNCKTWQNRRNPTQRIDQYDLYSSSEQSCKKQRQMYYFRKCHPQVVASLYLSSQNQNEFCSTNYHQQLFIEKIPIRLSDIEHIPFPDYLHLYFQCFNGYSQLANYIGFFIVEQEYIGINESGVAKVWMNEDFSKSYYIGGSVTQEIMVRSIVEVIDKNVDSLGQQNTPSVKNYLYRKTDRLTFQQANRQLNNFINEFNGGNISPRLTCIDKVGGIYVIANREKTSPQQVQTNHHIYTNSPVIPISSNKQLPQVKTYERPRLANSQILKNQFPVSTHRIEQRPVFYETKPEKYTSMKNSNLFPSMSKNLLTPSTVRQNIPIVRRNTGSFSNMYHQPRFPEQRLTNPPRISNETTLINTFNQGQSNIFSRSIVRQVRLQQSNARSQLNLQNQPLLQRQFSENRQVFQPYLPSNQISFQTQPPQQKILINVAAQQIPQNHTVFTIPQTSNSIISNNYPRQLPQVNNFTQILTLKSIAQSQKSLPQQSSSSKSISSSNALITFLKPSNPTIYLQNPSTIIEEDRSVSNQNSSIVQKSDKGDSNTFYKVNNFNDTPPQSSLNTLIGRQTVPIQQTQPLLLNSSQYTLSNSNKFNPQQFISDITKPKHPLVYKPSFEESTLYKFNATDSYNYQPKDTDYLLTSNKLDDVTGGYDHITNIKRESYNINTDDGKSSEDFLMKLKQFSNIGNYGSGLASNSEVVPQYNSSNLKQFQQQRQTFNRTFDIEEYKNPFEKKVNTFGQSNSYNISPIIQKQQPKQNVILQQNGLSEQQFGRSAVSNIFHNPGYYPNPTPKVSSSPLKFQNNLDMKYSMFQSQQPSYRSNFNYKTYQTNFDPDILADINKFKYN